MIQGAEADSGRLRRIGEHVTPVGGEQKLRERPDEAGARLHDGEKAARGLIDPLERAPELQEDFTYQPIVRVPVEETVDCQNRFVAPLGSKDQQANRGVIEPEMEDGIVQLPRHGERPIRRSDSADCVRRVGLFTLRPPHEDLRLPLFGVNAYSNVRVEERSLRVSGTQLFEREPFSPSLSAQVIGKGPCSSIDHFGEPAPGRDRIH